MRNKQEVTFNTWGNTSPDYYEVAYQKIKNRITAKNKGIRLSELCRMTLAEIRRRLKFHISLEDINTYNFRKWSAQRKLEWLGDLQKFIFNTLGKRTIKKLRGF